MLLLSLLEKIIKSHRKVKIVIEAFDGSKTSLFYNKDKDGEFIYFMGKERLNQARVHDLKIEEGILTLEVTT